MVDVYNHSSDIAFYFNNSLIVNNPLPYQMVDNTSRAVTINLFLISMQCSIKHSSLLCGVLCNVSNTSSSVLSGFKTTRRSRVVLDPISIREKH